MAERAERHRRQQGQPIPAGGFLGHSLRPAGKRQEHGEVLLPAHRGGLRLATAMRKGLVKTLLLDRRQELTELEHLDFKAEREYILLSEDDFYGLSHSGATLTDICDRCQVAASTAIGRLFN